MCRGACFAPNGRHCGALTAQVAVHRLALAPIPKREYPDTCAPAALRTDRALRFVRSRYADARWRRGHRATRTLCRLRGRGGAGTRRGHASACRPAHGRRRSFPNGARSDVVLRLRITRRRGSRSVHLRGVRIALLHPAIPDPRRAPASCRTRSKARRAPAWQHAQPVRSSAEPPSTASLRHFRGRRGRPPRRRRGTGSRARSCGGRRGPGDGAACAAACRSQLVAGPGDGDVEQPLLLDAARSSVDSAMSEGNAPSTAWMTCTGSATPDPWPSARWTASGSPRPGAAAWRVAGAAGGSSVSSATKSARSERRPPRRPAARDRPSRAAWSV